MQQYGIDDVSNEIKGLGVEWGTEEYYYLMEEMYEGFAEEGKKLPPPPRSSAEIKIALLRLIDEGNNDIRDIHAALYETDFHDELDDLVEVGMVVETDTGYYRPFQIRRV